MPWIMLAVLTVVRIVGDPLVARNLFRKIQKAILQRDGVLLTMRWAPTFFARGSNIHRYAITFLDGNSDGYQALCEPTLLASVKFSHVRRLHNDSLQLPSV